MRRVAFLLSVFLLILLIGYPTFAASRTAAGSQSNALYLVTHDGRFLVLSKLTCEVSSSDDGYSIVVCNTIGSNNTVNFHASLLFAPDLSVRFWDSASVPRVGAWASENGWVHMSENGTCKFYMSATNGVSGSVGVPPEHTAAAYTCTAREDLKGFYRVRTVAMRHRSSTVIGAVRVVFQGHSLVGGCLVLRRGPSMLDGQVHHVALTFGGVSANVPETGKPAGAAAPLSILDVLCPVQ